MTVRQTDSRGADLAERLSQGLREADHAALPGARDLPIVRGLTPQCQYIRPMENVLVEARGILQQSRSVFSLGSDIVIEDATGADQRLVTMASDYKIESCASSLMANLFVCELQANSEEATPIQFAPPQRFVEQLLNSRPTRATLPRIVSYATRPVFDEDFQLRCPGWHDDIGLLVHGPQIDIVLPSNISTAGPARDRLPPHLREFLRDFCLQEDADVANVVGLLLTAILMPHFVGPGKPICLVDANQPGTGKTWLALAIGQIVDGRVPRIVPYTSDDEELGKRVCAILRDNPQSQVTFDNAKAPTGAVISSPFIEASSTAPVISFRILGQSATFERPNDLLWFLTMNDTRASGDIVSRCLPVRFRYEGDPGRRDFGGRDPIEFARRHRVEILGELAGMVIHWTQAGRPRGQRGHRFRHWAEIIGGILEANHLPEFLGNLDDAAVEFNAALAELAALAEEANRHGNGYVVLLSAVPSPFPANQIESSVVGHPAGEWESVFRAAGVLDQELVSTANSRAKSTRIGAYLSQHVGREVRVENGDLAMIARLRAAHGRGRQKRYYFETSIAEVRPDDPPASPTMSSVIEEQNPQAPSFGSVGDHAAPAGNQEAW